MDWEKALDNREADLVERDQTTAIIGESIVWELNRIPRFFARTVCPVKRVLAPRRDRLADTAAAWTRPRRSCPIPGR